MQKNQSEANLELKTIDGKRRGGLSTKVIPHKQMRTSLSDNEFYQNLSEVQKEIFNEVYSLSELTINSLEDIKSIRIVRPCISLVMQGVLTQNYWEYFDTFYEFYFRRMSEEKRAFTCKFDKNLHSSLNENEVFKVFKVLAHVGAKEFLLVQFEPRFGNLDDIFEYHNQGEISWIHRDILGKDNPCYVKYVQFGYQEICGPFDLKSFNGRPNKRNADVNDCESVLEINGPSLDILHGLRNICSTKQKK